MQKERLIQHYRTVSHRFPLWRPLRGGLFPDWTIIAIFLALTAVSMLLLYSADGGGLTYVRRHIVNTLIALGIMVLFSHVPLDRIQQLTPLFYLLVLVLLVLVLAVGETGKGAQRWIGVGLIRLQPSELMKICLPLMLVWWLEKSGDSGKNLVIWGGYLLLALMPLFLVLLQPDLGTCAMIAANALAIIFITGVAWRHILAITVASLSALPVIWVNMHGYQKSRVLTFLDPYKDPLGSGYQIIQSQTAIGSGGISGKGWLNGSQSQLSFVPEQHTDFIFSLLAEEFGMVGVVFLFALYALVLWRGFHISYTAHNNFARFLAAVLTFNFLFNSSVNIGMVLGVLPIVGLPLPLISYGGSAQLSYALSFALLMAVRREALARKNAGIG